MIDIQFIRDNPKIVKTKTEQKGYKVDIDKLLDLDKERKSLLQQVEAKRQERNSLSASLSPSPSPSSEQIAQGRKIKGDLTKLKEQFKKVDTEWLNILKQVPNLAFDDVPIGEEDDYKILSTNGEKTKEGTDHLKYSIERDWLDFDRGAKVAGNKFYFVKGDLAFLENALFQFVLELVAARGFTYMTVPNMVNSRIITGAGFSPRTSNQSDEYFIENEDLGLIATAEIPLTGYHADEIIEESDLPIKYVGYSPCYRKEAGTYGKHTRGLFRVHQFNKVEMYAFTLPEKSAQMHEEIKAIEEKIWQSLEIPYKVINVATGDLGAPAAKKYDIEYWSPVDKSYRELTSCSNCTDYQTRNLNIKLRRKSGTIEYLHSLNGTAVALARTLVALIENNQQKDGKIKVPKVLQKYMGGRESI